MPSSWASLILFRVLDIIFHFLVGTVVGDRGSDRSVHLVNELVRRLQIQASGGFHCHIGSRNLLISVAITMLGLSNRTSSRLFSLPVVALA
ncbi:hypothetical protein EDB81DRAFT_775278 [Dactylonectria macrodidyma]|uniref:Uncharacterized protein n=1 Tax=Dactylonectria macrodidyma TaxID=307937 RepID=A0A9P9FRC1_9HYPO|nr:hypothetical protein EDB81DRAFT_775278 [Dactylonectria macrodidyma]